MKKIIFISLIILLLSMPVFAQETTKDEGAIKFILNFTNFGLGTNLPYITENYVVEGSFELLNFGIEHNGSHLGLSFSPFQAVGWIQGGLNCSFVNAYLYWNALGFLDTRFFISPIVSFHYLFMGEEFYFNKYIFSAGLESGISAVTDKIKYNIFAIETGFRLIEGEARFFAGVKFDFIMQLLRKQGFFD
ncbi:MAG: hypothetical protein LBI04_06970 [Treponema sp.]|jgi:hypothetical protein|nr:hypothetical protein [Treponema sp.]